MPDDGKDPGNPAVAMRRILEARIPPDRRRLDWEARWREIEAACSAANDESDAEVARALGDLLDETRGALAADRAAAECESSYVGDVYTAMIDHLLAEKG